MGSNKENICNNQIIPPELPNPPNFTMTSTSPLNWLITGSSSGLGLELSNAVLSAGHRVIATSRNPSKTPELVADFEARGGQWIQLNVTGGDVEERVEEAVKSFGGVDVLVNNAGFGISGTIEDTRYVYYVERCCICYCSPVHCRNDRNNTWKG